jgi:hypothetical protein
MAKVIFVVVSCLVGSTLIAQENTFHLNVLAYQWTTTHRTMTFSWPGYSNTSCNGNINVSGNSFGGNIYASGSTSSTCSATYTPPSSQNIDIQKPVVFVLAESETSRMLLSCTRNVRWSQCNALNPGQFVARLNNGHFEVKATFGNGKDEWIKFNVVQQSAISRPASAQTTPMAQTAPTSIEAPEVPTAEASSEFPKRWKSMNSGAVRVVRFEGEYIYAEQVVSEAAAKAGVFFLWEVKKEGDKYVGKVNGHVVKEDGSASCNISFPAELTQITKQRIEGRSQISWRYIFSFCELVGSTLLSSTHETSVRA